MRFFAVTNSIHTKKTKSTGHSGAGTPRFSRKFVRCRQLTHLCHSVEKTFSRKNFTGDAISCLVSELALRLQKKTFLIETFIRTIEGGIHKRFLLDHDEYGKLLEMVRIVSEHPFIFWWSKKHSFFTFFFWGLNWRKVKDRVHALLYIFILYGILK